MQYSTDVRIAVTNWHLNNVQIQIYCGTNLDSFSSRECNRTDFLIEFESEEHESRTLLID